MFLKNLGLVCAHWAIGTTILIGLAAAEFSGAKTLISIPISAISVTLTGLCGNYEDTETFKYRKRKYGDVVDFLYIWFDVLGYLAAAATCARIASVTIDYMSYGKLRELIFGLQVNTNEEPWPDILGVSVIILITILFMLGLEKSLTLSGLLCVGVLVGFIFLVIVGGVHTNIQLKIWTKDFKLHTWESVVTTAAVCSFGFINDYSWINENKNAHVISITSVTIFLYTVIALIFTMISHYRELVGTSIPLIRVFEVRDVSWARPFMAVFTITVVSLALTEILPALCKLFMKLASKEWQIFVMSLQYRSSLTGAPILSIFASGSLAAILAFACPLPYLIRLLNVSVLLKCAFKTSSDLYYRFKPTFSISENADNSSDVQYSKLSSTKNSKVKASPSVLQTLLNTAKNSASASSRLKKRNKKGKKEDKECLLMNSYSSSEPSISAANEKLNSSEDELSDSLAGSEADESSSSTDIDAAVQEYVDTVQVATVNNFENKKLPTVCTSRTVIFLNALIIISAITTYVCMYFKKNFLIWPNVLALGLSYITILKLPQNSNEQKKSLTSSAFLFPIFALTSSFMNTILASSLVKDVWPGLFCWFLSGLLLFWRCDCCTCDGLFVSDQSKNRNNNAPILSIFHNQVDPMDRVLISR